jgi:hypothetical protein
MKECPVSSVCYAVQQTLPCDGRYEQCIVMTLKQRAIAGVCRKCLFGPYLAVICSACLSVCLRLPLCPQHRGALHLLVYPALRLGVHRRVHVPA